MLPLKEGARPGAVLQGLKNKYQEQHDAVIEDAAIVAAARLANRYIAGTFKLILALLILDIAWLLLETWGCKLRAILWDLLN